MSRTRRGHRLDSFTFPLNMVRVFDEQGDRPAGCLARHHPTQDLDRVLLDLHPSAGAVTLLAAGQFSIDRFRRESETRGHSIQNGSERGSV